MPKAEQSLEEMLHEIRRIENHRVVLTQEKIRKIYKNLMKDLNAFIGEAYTKHADKDGNLSIPILQQKSKYAWFVNEIDKTCNKYLPLTTKEIQEIVDKVYKKSYDGMVEAIKTASDKELEGIPVNPKVLKQSYGNDIEKLTLPDLLEKHRKEIVYEIKQTLNIGLMVGQRYESMTRNIQEKLNFSYGKSNNIVRTETHRNIEAGFNDCAQEIAKGLEDSDIVYVKTWLTMKDERVRRTSKADHVKMEGVTVEATDNFKLEPGVYAPCPGSSGTARNDCNCRCTLDHNFMTREEFEKIKQK